MPSMNKIKIKCVGGGGGILPHLTIYISSGSVSLFMHISFASCLIAQLMEINWVIFEQ